jgi:hypothetical protein
MKDIQTTRLQALEARFASRIAARLSEQTLHLSHDISERLRLSRQQALAEARAVNASHATDAKVQQSSLVLHGFGDSSGQGGWWAKIAATLPLIALVGGLILIQKHHLRSQISTAADIDAALLADDLPPDAYSDPGFAEFLKQPPT